MVKPHSHGDRARNINALTAFRQHWGKSPGYPEENRGNDYLTLPVNVRYEWGGGKSIGGFQTSMRVSIHPGDDGCIEITPVGKYTTRRYHLGYSPDFQIYRYDDTEHALIVEGDSEKMKGAYRVTILPAIAKP